MKTVIVVPCYEEADRLPIGEFIEYVAGTPDVDFLFVNDGSRDETLEVLRGLEARAPGRISVLDQQPNQGKAETVRTGVNAAIARGVGCVGFLDADLATPLSEVPRMLDVLERRPHVEMVFGARVQLLGRRIERRRARHYLGRVFATVASETLGLRVYDTQCGAKLFRVSPQIAELFAEPFLTRWIFDVEILARLIQARRGTDAPAVADVIYELPLEQWTHVDGSKVRAMDFFRAMREMWMIRRRYLGRKARVPARVRELVPPPASPRRSSRSRRSG